MLGVFLLRMPLVTGINPSPVPRERYYYVEKCLLRTEHSTMNYIRNTVLLLIPTSRFDQNLPVLLLWEVRMNSYVRIDLEGRGQEQTVIDR